MVSQVGLVWASMVAGFQAWASPREPGRSCVVFSPQGTEHHFYHGHRWPRPQRKEKGCGLSVKGVSPPHCSGTVWDGRWPCGPLWKIQSTSPVYPLATVHIRPHAKCTWHLPKAPRPTRLPPQLEDQDLII